MNEAGLMTKCYSAPDGHGGRKGTILLSRRFGNFRDGAFFRATDLHGTVIADRPMVREKANLTGDPGASRIFGCYFRLVETDE
jgi:hypothetical protein